MGALKKPCAVCGGVLRGLRTRFCSKSCANNYEQERKKKKYDLLKRHLKKRKCWVCKENYEPRTSRQQVCSRRCRNILSGRKRREEKNKEVTILGGGRGKFGRGVTARIPVPYIKKEETEEVQMINKSDYQQEIKDYLSRGGKVTKFTPLPSHKTPSVGVPLRLGNWTAETLLGFGSEIDIMESDYDTEY